MEWLAGARVALTPRPVPRRDAVLEVAMLGHCPGRVRLARLHDLTAALEDMRAAGLNAQVDALLAGEPAELYHRPIPLRASAEFHDIFPDAAAAGTGYASLLAGQGAWLAQAVDDFFANGGEKLWVVRVPEEEGQRGFLPADDSLLHAEALRGIATVLAIPSVAVLALPDLERLQIPARLPDFSRVRLDNPDPCFLPCGETLSDGHRERRNPGEIPHAPDPAPLESLLREILAFVARNRPDVQCLLTLPLAYSGELDSPVADPAALKTLAAIRDHGSGSLLRHGQFLFPYLRGPRFALRSPVGVVAGQQSAVARQAGPWRSMAARPLTTDALPYPRLCVAETLRLRDEPGIWVLQYRSGRVSLDDERLVVPALPPADSANSPGPGRFDPFRSAEAMRFLGYLRRQLQRLGEQLVFRADHRDPRPRLLLDQFFRSLHAQGALRGRLPEDAYRVTESQPGEGMMLFEIMVAPALPIDRLFLTFTNLDGEWQAEVAGG